MFARLDSAVVTQGVLLAESQRKTVEHLEGGILTRAPGQGRRPGRGRARSSRSSTPPRPRSSSPRSRPTAWPRLRHLAARGRRRGPDRARSGDGARGAREGQRRARSPPSRPLRRPAARPRRPDRRAAAADRPAPRPGRGEQRPGPRRRAPARELAGGARSEPRPSSTRARARARSSSSSTAHRARSKASATRTAASRGRGARGHRPRRGRHRDAAPAAAGRGRRAAVRGAPQVAALDGQIRGAATCSSAASCARRRPAWWSRSARSRPGAVVGSGEPLMEIVPDGDRLSSRRACRPMRSTPSMSAAPAEVRLTAYQPRQGAGGRSAR